MWYECSKTKQTINKFNCAVNFSLSSNKKKLLVITQGYFKLCWDFNRMR